MNRAQPAHPGLANVVPEGRNVAPRYQSSLPGSPLIGPVSVAVTQPP
jgi:hypothetical protein